MPSEQMRQIPLPSASPNSAEWRATDTRGATGALTPTARRGKLCTPNSALRTLFWSLPFLLAGLCFWQALPGPRAGSPLSATAAVFPAKAIANQPAKRTLITRPIQDIRPGMRVIAKNPELHGQDVPEIAIVPEDTRLVSLHMVKPDGHELTIETLVPLESLCAAIIERLASGDSDFAIEPRPLIGTEEDVFLNEILVGYEFELHLAELGAEGPASITSIQPCLPIESDDGTGRRLVTSVFRHAAANVIDVAIGSSDQSIGVTANHPFWSEDRQSFIPAGELRLGENLRKADGTLTQVTRINPRRGPPVPVFNFEVDGQHVYSVGADGILVHNAYNNMGKYSIYLGVNKITGLIDWVGITRKFAARSLVQKAVRTIQQYLNNAGYRQARLLEVELIQQLSAKGIVLANKQKQIGRTKMSQYTAEQMQFAKQKAAEIMRQLGMN